MRCPQCNEELTGSDINCDRCGNKVVEVKVLRPDERDDFQGLTLQQGEDVSGRNGYATGQSGDYEYRSEGPGHRVYVRQVSLGSKPFGFLTKLIVLALILFFVFIALPVAVILMAVFSLVWWLMRR
jgi:hypothetical protein